MVGNLLAYQHLLGGGEIACGERVEIDTTRDGFTYFVSAIPMRRAAPTLIHTSRLTA